jgi:transglutaminase-like putative cysteine protease
VNFTIRYLSEYRYSEPASDNLNVLRVKPGNSALQTCEEFTMRVDPEARLHTYRDYFGTEVIEFGIAEPHDALTMDARMRVTTHERPEPPAGDWEEVAGSAYRVAGNEFLLMRERSASEAVITAMATEVRGESPLATALAVSEVIPDRFEYNADATFVGSTIEDLIEGGGGVCQDFVHLANEVLRANGVAARYVSGYLFAAPPDGGTDSVEVLTHAWVEALITVANGVPTWVAVDPTNRGIAGETHVKVGHGRDYSDVSPIRGVYRGGGGAELDVAVEMRRSNGGG